MNQLADLRKDYTQASLDEGSVCKDPFQQFEIWLNEALKAKLPEPQRHGFVDRWLRWQPKQSCGAY